MNRMMTAAIAVFFSTIAKPVFANGLLSERPAAQRPTLAVLGTVHFDNPGLDTVKASVPAVLRPVRQREIAQVVEVLARFRPTHVVVEWPIDGQSDLDRRYAEYRAGRYRLGANEVDQLGLRLAARLGLPRVDAGDWNKMPPGTEQDFDYEVYAAGYGLGNRLRSLVAAEQTDADRLDLPNTSVAAWLRAVNAPSAIDRNQRRYFDYALLGEPGANWVGNWYGRNLKIFARLVQVASRPDDRVLAIFGAGHVWPLTTYAERAGAFRVVNTLRLLPRP